VALADYLDAISDQSLVDIAECVEGIIRDNVENDRVVVPVIDAMAGFLEEDVFSRIYDQYESIARTFLLIHRFRRIFILTQKVGYKSGNVMKLIACARM
jgi:Tubulin folding cofactor D C terminal